MLEFKEGQTYICKKSYTTWWTEGGEYAVFINENRDVVIQDDMGDQWCDYEIGSVHQFTLKKKKERFRKEQLKKDMLEILEDLEEEEE